MKTTSIFIVLLSCLLSITRSVQAQHFITDSTGKFVDLSPGYDDKEIHPASVKKLPDYAGGKKAWQDFLRANIDIKIPFTNKALPGIYKVMIRYIVKSDGSLSGIGADSNCGYGMESEVIRCIHKSKGWIPAESGEGKKVSFTMRTIVVFNVKEKDVVISF